MGRSCFSPGYRAGEESKDGGAIAWFVCCGVGPVGRTVGLHSAARLCNAGLCCRRGCKRLTLLYVQRDSTCLKKLITNIDRKNILRSCDTSMYKNRKILPKQFPNLPQDGDPGQGIKALLFSHASTVTMVH